MRSIFFKKKTKTKQFIGVIGVSRLKFAKILRIFIHKNNIYNIYSQEYFQAKNRPKNRNSQPGPEKQTEFLCKIEGKSLIYHTISRIFSFKHRRCLLSAWWTRTPAVYLSSVMY